MTGGGAGSRGAEEPRAGGILREGFDYDFSRCDPTGAHVDPAWCAVYEVLTASGPGGGLGSMIAESWQREQPDSPVWRIRIRSHLRFQSGDACDAAAVAGALRLHADPVEAPINAFFWRNVKRIDSDGDRDVLIELHEPSVGMPRLLRSWHSAIHNQARRRLAGDDFGRTTCDGTGPFRFVECVPGSHLDVARWDGYDGTKTSWEANRGPAYLDGIRWLPILDDRDRASALENGEVDCIQNASLLDVDRLSANPDLEVIEFQQSALVYLGLDHRDVARVRRRPCSPCRLARDRPSRSRRDRPDGARLARVRPDPVALAVAQRRGRGLGQVRSTRGGRAARRRGLRCRPGWRSPRAGGGGSRRRDRPPCF